VDPYRDDRGGRRLEAPTQEGTLTLELEPRRLLLAVGSRYALIEDDFATFEDNAPARDRRAGARRTRRRRRRKHTSERLGDRRLVLARDVPHEDLALWLETEDGGMRRMFGVEPQSLISDGGLAALRQLDRLAGRLRLALAEHSGGVRRAFEMGRGLDKVLLCDYGGRLVLYKRELFRDHARRACEVSADGTVKVIERGGDHVVTCRQRHGVSLLGDYIRFSDPSGLDLARVAVPWVTREDREELARRFGELVQATDSV